MTLIDAALGKLPVDLLITNVQVANVFTGEVYPADIAIYQGRIAAVEKSATLPPRQAVDVLDGGGRIAVPGLIDAHLHIESTLVTPAHFAEAVLPLGITTVLEDPHEVANVLGIDGIRAMMAASQDIPLKVEYLISSSVPSAAGLERTGGVIGPDEVTALIGDPHVLGLAEVMDGAGILAGDERLRAILRAGGGGDGMRVDSPGVIEGHNPMLRGRELAAFVAGGVDSDHTLSTPEDLVEKARQGVVLMLQERYLSRESIAALEALPHDIGLCLVTDDVAPDYLLERGHLDQVLRRTIELGMDPMRALRSVTLNPARRMRLWDRGLIAPGRAADIVLVDDLADFHAHTVLVDGKIVAQDGRCLWSAPARDGMYDLTGTVPLPQQTAADFTIRAPVDNGRVPIHLIDCVPGQTLVRKSVVDIDIADGVATGRRHGLHLRRQPLRRRRELRLRRDPRAGHPPGRLRHYLRPRRPQPLRRRPHPRGHGARGQRRHRRRWGHRRSRRRSADRDHAAAHRRHPLGKARPRRRGPDPRPRPRPAHHRHRPSLLAHAHLYLHPPRQLRPAHHRRGVGGREGAGGGVAVFVKLRLGD
ncbi:MAG: amidohydrolase family protein [Caldilineaceae bacterium]